MTIKILWFWWKSFLKYFNIFLSAISLYQCHVRRQHWSAVDFQLLPVNPEKHLVSKLEPYVVYVTFQLEGQNSPKLWKVLDFSYFKNKWIWFSSIYYIGIKSVVKCVIRTKREANYATWLSQLHTLLFCHDTQQ